MVTPINLLEAAKVPLFLQTSLKPVEVLSLHLQFNSHHPTQHKRSVARTLLDRAKNIPSTDADTLSEVQHVVNALNINAFTDLFITGAELGIFSGGGEPLRNGVTNTNKPHFCRIPVVLESRRSSQGGVHTPCTLPLDPPLY